MKPELQNKDEFRDLISTVHKSGQRKWIYAMQPKGWFYNVRTYLSILYLIVLIGLPFIHVNGEPLFLFDLVHGKFIIFGRLFLPQDFILFGLAMLIFLLFIIVFTLAYGRVFCGWVCPQTIFMEMVFRRIEYWIEGSAKTQMNHDHGVHTMEYFGRKVLKHVVFFVLSFLIANIFLSYIIGIDQLKKIVTEPINYHFGGFLAIFFFSFAFYIVYAYVREIVCTVVCPYGRLQGVLLDSNSMIVAYDYKRGETRARESRSRAADAGDCIDCGLCVEVCPTGIDIRNGTQMECIHCTACIDACNLMMKKTKRAPDLIRYASERSIKVGEQPRFTYRMKVYTAVLVILASLMTFLLIRRSSVEVTLMRVPGQLLQAHPDGSVTNLYRIKLINTANKDMQLILGSPDLKSKIEIVGKPIDTIKSGQSIEEMFFIHRDSVDITDRELKIPIEIYNGSKRIFNQKTIFIGYN